MSEATRTVDGTVLPTAGTWSIDPVHSHIEFTVRHLVIGKTKGRFDTFSGTVDGKKMSGVTEPEGGDWSATRI